MKARRTELDIMVAKMNATSEHNWSVGYDAAGISKGSIRWKYCLMRNGEPVSKWRGSKAAVLNDIRYGIAKSKARAA